MDASAPKPLLTLTLAEWVKARAATKLARQELCRWLAGELQITDQALGRYMRDRSDPAFRVPRREIMTRIYQLTEGVVSPNSFYELPELVPARLKSAGRAA